MKVALTGHRPERLHNHETEIREWIKDRLLEKVYNEAYSGMAQGADQIFAEVAEELNIPLHCCYPYKRDKFHPAEENIMKKADSVRFISDDYSKKCYWVRDKFLVDNCDVLLAVWDGKKTGGTWLTIEYAQRIGKPVIYYPQELLK